MDLLKGINNKMNKHIIVMLLFFLVTKTEAQQDFHFSQYMYNMNIVNPAYAGLHKAINIRAFGRTEWVGVNGAPQTFTSTIQAPLGSNLGGGISFVNDKIGPISQNVVTTDFSYTLKTSYKANLAFGIKGGFSFINSNLQLLTGADKELFNYFKENETKFNFGIGVFYYANDYYFGISIPFLLNADFLDEKTKGGIVQSKNYFITGGYVFNINNNKLKTSFLYKGNKDTLKTIDIATNLYLNNGLEFGVSYRFKNTISALFNIEITKKLRLGYAYEYNFSNLATFSSGSHEIMFLYDFNLEKNYNWRGKCF